MPLSDLSRAVLLLLLTAAAAACQVRDSGAKASVAVDCRHYDPVAAKRTFGRVGRITLHNAGTRPVAVAVYHPDGDGKRCGGPSRPGRSLTWAADSGTTGASGQTPRA